MMLVQRYIIREIARPAITTCLLLVFMFGSYIATRYWADAAQGELSGATAFALICLRILIALEVLIPTTLFLSVVTALHRMNRDNEITALAACGIGPATVMRAVFTIGLLASMMTAALSLQVRPWAWTQFFSLKAEAKASFDITRMKSGTFYELWKGKRVIFARSIGKNRARGIFIKTRRPDGVEVISAESATQFMDRQSSMPILMLRNGHQYRFSDKDQRDFMVDFEKSAMLVEPEKISKKLKVKSFPLGRILSPKDPEEMAELQWRLIAPVSTILLALVGVPLAKSGPRRAKFASAPLALIVFATYYYLAATLKKWVAQGVIPEFPGVWFSQIFLIILLFVLIEISRRRQA